LFAVNDDELRGNPLVALVSDKAHWSALMSKLFDNGEISLEEVEFLRGEATSFWGLVTATPLEFEGQPSVLVWVYDVTHLRNAREQMASMAYQDSLTRLGNRRYFSEATIGAISRARKNNHPCALLFCDLDGFKAINDEYGHETGDAVLIEVSRRFESCLRKGDIVARMGGDEFAILLEESPASKKVEVLAEKIRNRISDPISHDGIKMQVGVSIGVVVISDVREQQDLSLDSLIQIADRAMYSAKQGGKGRVVLVNHRAA
jgi:diguanylate cyclase (GGDEF)-like protein